MSDANQAFCGGLTDADDAPALNPPANQPTWTENLWWIAHDSKNGIGLMVHLGSTRHDFNVVRQTILFFLPDGRVATDVSVGGFRQNRSVRGATLSMECIEPFRQWRIACNGVAQAATTADLWNDSPRQAAKPPLKIDLQAQCLGPVWEAAGGNDAAQMHSQEWASSHYQQTIRLHGSVEFDGTRYALDGTGVRDHSRGPRDFANWHGHALCSAPFPGGRSFGLMSVIGPGGGIAYRSAYVVRNGVLERGLPAAIPPLSAAILKPETIPITIEVNGRIESIVAHTRHRGLLSMLAPYDVTPGINRQSPGGIALGEALATFTWDGESAQGIVERSARAATLPRL